MQRFQDYRQLADRSAQLAIACSEPSLKAALMTLAMNYTSASISICWHKRTCSKNLTDPLKATDN